MKLYFLEYAEYERLVFCRISKSQVLQHELGGETLEIFDQFKDEKSLAQ